MPDPAAVPSVTIVVPASVPADAGATLPQPGATPLGNGLADPASLTANPQPSGGGEALPMQLGEQVGDSLPTPLGEQPQEVEPVRAESPQQPVQTPAQPVVQTPPQSTFDTIASPTTAPEGETGQVSSEPASDLGEAQPAQFEQSDSNPVDPPTADDLPVMADSAVVLSTDGVAEAPPAVTVGQPVATSKDSAPAEVSREDQDVSVIARDSRQAPDAASQRASTTNMPDSAGTRDFAQLVQNNSADAATPATEGGEGTVEMLGQTRADPAKFSTDTVRPAASVPGTVSARPGEIGHQLGVEIARHSRDGRDSLTIRLDPAEMGEIHIRLQFDDKGTMRAHVTAESSAALEMLRRDSGDLVRALGDAGVRTDAQSFQFEARSQGRGDQQGQHNRPGDPSGADPAQQDAEGDDGAQPARAKLLGSGSLDLFA